MEVKWWCLLLAYSVSLVSGAQVTLTCPVLFFVTELSDYLALSPSGITQVDYGTYFLRNGTQFPQPFYLPTTVAHDMWETNPCSILINIITDDARLFNGEIVEWINLECKRLGKKKKECYRPVSMVFSSKPKEEHTASPMTSPTTAPTIPRECDLRVDSVSCESTPDCSWFGAVIGCQVIGYCKFDVREACLMRRKYCKWSKQLGCTAIR